MDALCRAARARDPPREATGLDAAALPRLHFGLATAATAPTSMMTTSTLALVIQGAKRTGLGSHTFDYGAGPWPGWRA